MGGLVIETVRPGVQFTPEAAAAFRRAEAQVRAEFRRDIDSNSTWRDWDLQLRMYNAWIAHINGRGPHPGHSKALHPADPLAFHTKGIALDSDDWRNARIVQILAENGFIRNRLDVPNENHHFEWIRSRDTNYGKPVPGTATAPAIPVPKEDDDMQSIAINGKQYGVKEQYITHYGGPTATAQADITRKVMSATDELHDLNQAYPKDTVAKLGDLLDGLGIPRNVLDGNGFVLNPQSGKYENNGTWSREREILAGQAALGAKLDKLLAG